MRSAWGLTIVEVLVAVLILNVGLLGLVATAGAVTRMIGQGRMTTVAAALAGEKLEALRSQGCPAPGSGSETRADVAVVWEIEVPPFPKARTLLVAVRWVTPSGPRADSITTVLYCP